MRILNYTFLVYFLALTLPSFAHAWGGIQDDAPLACARMTADSIGSERLYRLLQQNCMKQKLYLNDPAFRRLYPNAVSLAPDSPRNTDADRAMAKLLSGMERAGYVDKISEINNLIRDSEDPSKFNPRLAQEFGLTPADIKAVMPIFRHLSSPSAPQEASPSVVPQVPIKTAT